jgi:hypothetical protein
MTEHRRLDAFELTTLAVLLALSLWVLGFNLWQIAAQGRAWTGTDGYFPVDQLQYLAWVRDASQHLFASDLYVLRATPHDYLEPVVALAGGLTALGVAPWLALLAFGPLAVISLFLALRAYCRRLLAGLWEWRAALVLALFFGSFGVLGDEWIPFLTWGYVPAVIAIAAMTGALVAYDRALAGGRLWVAPALGLLASWTHPWQGEELLIMVVVIELAGLAAPGWRQPRPASAADRLRLLALTVAATSLPLLYYAALDRADPTWRLAQAAGLAPWPLGKILLPLAPLIAFAFAGYLERPRTFLEAATRAWPISALVVYGLSSAGIGAGPLHAFNGITIPLTVLAVVGARRAGLDRIPGHRAIAALAVALATIPASIHMIVHVPGAVSPPANNEDFVSTGVNHAFEYLAGDPEPGGVLTTPSLGTVLPGDTGRRTYVGDCYWSVPDCPSRMARAEWLFWRPASARAVRDFVTWSGARFVLVPCGARRDLEAQLGPLTGSVRHFGCTTVLTIATATTSRARSTRLTPAPSSVVQFANVVVELARERAPPAERNLVGLRAPELEDPDISGKQSRIAAADGLGA